MKPNDLRVYAIKLKSLALRMEALALQRETQRQQGILSSSDGQEVISNDLANLEIEFSRILREESEVKAVVNRSRG